MNQKLENTISYLVKSFSDKFDDFQGLYLFGIHSDGNLHENEDIEIVAIFDVENKFKREAIWPIIGKIETDLNVCIDLYPMTMEDLEKDDELYDEVINFGKFFEIIK